MPQPKQYANRAQQQAAYRKRRTCSEQELLAQKGLPPLPAIPTLPGHARWRAMLWQAQMLLCAATEEMQTYHDERSEAWQESTNAEELLAKLERLQETMAQLEDCA
jgi:hypothetical protein